MTAMYRAIVAPFLPSGLRRLTRVTDEGCARRWAPYQPVDTEYGTICAPAGLPQPWYDSAMQNAELEVLAHQAFPTATRIILPAGDPGGTLFHDADAEWQAAGIGATSWVEGTGTLYLRRLPPPRALRSEPRSLTPPPDEGSTLS